MYHGRSIGRMLEWLRNLVPCADELIFHGDGTIRLYDKVVVRKVDWDEYDTPTFDFAEGYGGGADSDHLEELRRRELRGLMYTTSAEATESLRDLRRKPFCEGSIRRDRRPAWHQKLTEQGLVSQTMKLRDWDDDGAPLYDVSIEVSPQGYGFLNYLDGKEEEDASDES